MEMRASDCMKSFSCAQLFKTLSLSACLAFGFSFASHAQMQSSQNYQIAVQKVPDEIYGKRIVGQSFLNELYQSLGGKLLWQSEAARAELREEIKNSWKDGLKPADFHQNIIEQPAGTLSPLEEDIIYSDAFARLLYQLQNGKTNPETLDQDWNYNRLVDDPKAVSYVAEALKNGDITGFINTARPKDDVLNRLSQALQTYQAYVDTGGWGKVASGKAMKPGETHNRIGRVRVRLAATEGYNPNQLSESKLYDEDLKIAVQAFQHKHGLEADGVIGKGTIKAMNVSAQERVDQIRVNMERARWIGKALEDKDDMVIVNIASYELLLIQNGEMSWRSDVIVGKDYRKTPVFTGKMQYVEMNPTWTIPPGILRRDILPRFRKDANYLVNKGYNLYDRSGGLVDSTQIDWKSLNGRFPYTIVQPPGEKNALGRIKFIFPNKHSVYLHDTPSRSLFNKSARAFSSGCIRVKDPTKFAEFVLRDNQGWDKEKIENVLASKKQTRVNLTDRLDTAILYWTVDAISPDGVRFYEDIYDRDGKVLEALNAPFNP